jgi:hypothetical protein
VTSDASGKLAEKSRTWASDIRASLGESGPDAATPPSAASDTTGSAATGSAATGDAATGSAPPDVPPSAPGADRTPTDGPTSPG